MAKSRKSRQNVVKNIAKTANKALPVVDKSLERVGNTAKNVAKSSAPVIEKGVSAVYDTMVTGLDLGIKGAKSVARGVSRSKRRRSRKTGSYRRRHKSRRH
jgi:autotransporter adhesin